MSTSILQPGITGLELAKELAEIRTDIPVIVCTGFSEAINRGNGNMRVVRKIMMKPCGLRELGEAIRNVLHPGS